MTTSFMLVDRRPNKAKEQEGFTKELCTQFACEKLELEAHDFIIDSLAPPP